MLAFLRRIQPRQIRAFKRYYSCSALAQENSYSHIIGSDYVVRSPLPDIQTPMESIYRMVSKDFSRFGSKIGLVDGVSGREYSFNEIDESANRFSSALRGMGFGKGDPMCIVAPNSPEYIIIFLGTLAAGGVVSTCNPAFTANELAYQFNSSGAKIITTTPALLSTVQAAAAKANVEKIIVLDTDQPQNSSGNLISYQSLANHSGPLYDPVPTEPEDVAVLPYSSGTTGLPKGVMLTNANINSNLLQFTHPEIFNLRDQPSTCLLGILPFFHIYGMVVVFLSCLINGTKLVTLPKFEPELFLSSIEKHRVSLAQVVPPLVVFLAKSDFVNKYDLSSLNDIVTGAAPLGEEVIRATKKRIKCNMIRQLYGLTEVSCISHMMPLSLGNQFPGSIGQCLRSVKVKVVDPDSRKVLPPKKEGELWISGPNVMKGYLNNPEATRKCMEGEWFKSGDIGYYDDQGLFYITDRLKELIKVKGFQVAPAELEALLLTHPKIADAAVIGIPNERLGEAPKAFVVKKEAGVSEKEIKEFVEKKVTKHKYLIGGVEFIDVIPKSASGKILRRVLRSF